jgi:hypothetical protein
MIMAKHGQLITVVRAGVYKNWPTSSVSLVDVTRVEELRVLRQTEVNARLSTAQCC